MKLLRLLAAFLAILVQPALAQTAPPIAAATQVRPPKFPSSAFAERSGLEDVRLSPDGKLIALKAASAEGKVRIGILDAATKKAVKLFVLPEKNELEWFRWAGPQRLLISMSTMGTIFGEDFRFTRLMVFDFNTGKTSFVGRREMGPVGDDLIYADPAGQFVLLAIQKSIYDYPSVYRFPLDGTAEKAGKEVQSPKTDVWSWIADSEGVIRMGIQTSDSKSFKVLYRLSAAEPFKTIGKIRYDSPDSDFLDVVGIISQSDEGLILKQDDSGKVVLRKYNYATRTPGETVFAAPGKWDIDTVTLDEKGQPIAAFYTDDRDKVEWFDPKMKSLYTRFGKALKGKDIWITSRASDGSRMIVWAGSENDPGTYFIYTAADAKMDAFYAEKVNLNPDQLPAPKPVSYKARDGSEITAYLTLPMGRTPKGLPLIVLPHGGPYGIRDRLEFNSEVQFLANRGYAVLQPNYRGSGGYGEAFSELGEGQIGRKMQDDLDDAMDWAVAQGIADAKRVCVVGSSYGGYAALWAVTRNPERYRCAASFAGVTDWKKQLAYDSGFFTREGGKKWKARVRGADDKFDLDLVSPAQQVSRLTRPVLLAHGEEDTNVPFKQFKQMRDAAAKAGKPIDLLTFPEEGHGFDKAENEVKWLETLEAFLTKHNPAD